MAAVEASGRASRTAGRGGGPTPSAAPQKAATAKKAAKKSPPAKKPAKASGTKPAAAAKSPTKSPSPPAKKAAAKKSPATKAATGTKRPAAKQAAPAKAAPKKQPAAKKASPAKKAAAAKKAPAAKATAPSAPPVPKGSEWTRAELRAVRAQLVDELNQMTLAYDRSLSDLNDLQRANTDGAGDDQADAGNKTFEREQEQSIAANRFDLLAQIRRAVERIDAGTYGYCESCGKPIPKARLKAFPSATLDVACKQREERR